MLCKPVNSDIDELNPNAPLRDDYVSTPGYITHPPFISSSEGLSIAMPNSCSLSFSPVQDTTNIITTPLTTSGPLAFPANHPTSTISQVGKGVLIAIGSIDVFHDSYLLPSNSIPDLPLSLGDKCDNMAFLGGLMDILLFDDKTPVA